MRNCISGLIYGKLIPILKERYFLSNGGTPLPTKYIIMNFYKEHRGLLSFAFENAQDGSTLSSVARNALSFPAYRAGYFPLKNNVYLFSPSTLHNSHYAICIETGYELLIEHQILRKYNNYRTMIGEKKRVKDLLAEARAIHFAMRNGAITYQDAKNRVQPILLVINNHVGQVAKRNKVKPRFIRFQDLGRSF